MSKLRLLALAALTMSASCATTHVDPAFYRARTIAIVSFHGNQAIVGTAGLLAALQSQTNSWGDDVIGPIYDKGSQRIAQAMQAKLLLPDDVERATSYASIPTWGAGRSTVEGLRPLKTDDGSEPVLGALARELDVDAVVAVRFQWSIEGDSVGNQRGVAVMEVVVVGRDGSRLWRQTELGEVPSPATWSQAGAQMLGAMNVETAKEMVDGASTKAMERFFDAVVKNRPASWIGA